MPRPIILVDQDGPLADFDARFWRACRHFNIEMDCEEHEQTARFATDHVIKPYQRRFIRSHVDKHPRWFHDLPVVQGAVEGINLLAEVAEVYICTKPLEANVHCRDGKAYWVRKHLGKDWEQRLIIAPDKSLVHGDILLDDAIKPEWLYRASWSPVVFPTCWNDWSGNVPATVIDVAPRWTWGDPVERLLHGVYV